MRYAVKQYANALHDSLAGVSSEGFSDRVRNFLKMLQKEGQMRILPQVLAELERIERERTGTKLISVSTAAALSDETRTELGRIFPKGEIDERVDTEIFGGLVAEWDDYRVDGSVRGQFRKLKSFFGK